VSGGETDFSLFFSQNVGLSLILPGIRFSSRLSLLFPQRVVPSDDPELGQERGRLLSPFFFS